MKNFVLFLFLMFSLSGNAQQLDKLDVRQIEGNIRFSPQEEMVFGNLMVQFKIKKATDSIYLDAHHFELLPQKNPSIKISATSDKIWLVGNFKPQKEYSVRLEYEAKPKQTLYFVGWNNEGSNQIWTQGQGKYTSHWLPSIDDVNDKIEFDLNYTVPKDYQVIANGKLEKIEKQKENHTYFFDMQNPMSSYLVAVIVGKYEVHKKTSASGKELFLYIEPQDAEHLTSTYRYSKRMFDFLENEIGVPFPWQNYKQVPVRDFLYAGMENTTATVFSNQFVVDEIGFTDKNYINVNAHELAHQWFGDLVTETSSEHHWLQEGFATYYALLVEKEIFGEDYYYHKLYQTAEQLKALSDSGKGEALLNPKASSLTFYQKGAWALHILNEKIGRENFRKGVKNYLEKYAYQNVSTDDFLAEMEKVTQQDLSDFKRDWLQQSAFQTEDVYNSFKNSSFMMELLHIKSLAKLSFSDKKEALSQALDFPVNDYIGQEAVFQLASENIDETYPLYQKAFESNNIYVRQAIAASVRKIPRKLKTNYETLLEDDSYLTKEYALYNLWMNFEEDRISYLEKTQGIEGFSDKNIELLHLTLSLVTPNYKNTEKPKLFEKLSSYTQTQYDYSIRQKAFEYLYQLNQFSPQNYKDLLEASAHSVWRFRSFARQMLDELWKDAQHQQAFKNLLGEVEEEHQNYVRRK
ncbi:M1 family metallopeptidase [Mesonia sp. K7]|uniref:M1 family metallopeptidase n=1 Tax=Mesonia sp. K7 TaxID=2218606 RepID=UPI000DAA37BA|nr:M1 family metallopeptidase [Mesonia sp. K7]PZD79694.1 M1 family peptidase [Mesonia sp. K7]